MRKRSSASSFASSACFFRRIEFEQVGEAGVETNSRKPSRL